MNENWLVAQLAVTSALAGLSWVVQLGVYPLFRIVLREAGAEGFRRYHAAYTGAMGWVAAPLMLVEAGLAAAWCVRATHDACAWAGAACVGVAWWMTFVVIVRLHGALQREPNDELAKRVTVAHAIRTAAWTARAAGLWWLVSG